MVSLNVTNLRVNKLTTKGKIARRKLALMEIAKELSNVSRARKLMDYTRQQFHEIRCNLKIYAPSLVKLLARVVHQFARTPN